jgi:hypothetical protein
MSTKMYEAEQARVEDLESAVGELVTQDLDSLETSEWREEKGRRSATPKMDGADGW